MSKTNIVSAAMELHQKGKIKEAEEAYKLAIKSHPKDKRLYCNLAALIRSQGRPEEAAHIAQKGIVTIGGESPVLLNTLGNSLRDLDRHAEAINCFRRALKGNPDYFDAEISLLDSLERLGLNALAKGTIYGLINKYGFKKKSLVNRVIEKEVQRAGIEGRELHPTVERWMHNIQIEAQKEELPKAPDHWFQAAQICLRHKRVDDANKFFSIGQNAFNSYKSLKVRKLTDDALDKIYHINCWNFGCGLLKHADFARGWKLYDHGLRTPAEGAQRWQRALYKPFSLARLPLWKGEKLKGKKILLLGEQGIGDSMMFITCVPKLLKEGAKITLLLPHRLKEIYERSFKTCTVISEKDARKNPLNPDEYDFQCPLGSIPQYRFKHLSDYGEEMKVLTPNEERVELLKNRYGKEKKLIGISWQGGGKAGRIKDKSIDLFYLCKILKKFNARFISLQYGDDAKVVKNVNKKIGIDIIDDPEIQATKDMNSWVDQVAVCERVISIANTTIHAAGGLGIPTICLLGQKPDWRWLIKEKQTHSYWYPSVKIARQNEENKQWGEAINMLEEWLKESPLR